MTDSTKSVMKTPVLLSLLQTISSHTVDPRLLQAGGFPSSEWGFAVLWYKEDFLLNLCKFAHTALGLITQYGVVQQVKKHSRDSFLSLMYPAVPLSSPEDPPVSLPPASSCHSPTSTSPTCDALDAAWDFS